MIVVLDEGDSAKQTFLVISPQLSHHMVNLQNRRQLLAFVVPTIACCTMFAACSRDLTEPNLNMRQSADVIDALSQAPTVDTISVDWTVEQLNAQGERITKHEAFTRMVGNVAVKHGSAPPTAIPRPDSVVTSLRHMPLPTLTVDVPNRARFGPWTRVAHSPDNPNVRWETTGEGNGPATELRRYDHDSLIMVIRSSWTHGLKGWDLVEQDATTPDGTFHSSLHISHANESRPGIDAVTGFKPARLFATKSGKATVSATGFGVQNTFDDCVSEKCSAFHDAFVDQVQDNEYLMAAALLACFAGTPGDPLCWAALAAVTSGLQKEKTKRIRWEDCVSKAKIECRKCFDDDAANPFGHNADTISSPRKLSGEDCNLNWTYDDPPPTGGGGGSTSGGRETCYWVVWWDETGTIIGVDFLGCIEEM